MDTRYWIQDINGYKILDTRYNGYKILDTRNNWIQDTGYKI